jgi:hypothetical protein
MLRATCVAVLLSATLLGGCSGQHTLNEDELKSTATEIISIASEGELFAAAAAEHHAPAKYVEGHPKYLRKEADEIAQELGQGRPEPNAKPQFDQLLDAVAQLSETLDRMPASATDPRWQQSRSELNNIRLKALEIRKKL